MLVSLIPTLLELSSCTETLMYTGNGSLTALEELEH